MLTVLLAVLAGVASVPAHSAGNPSASGGGTISGGPTQHANFGFTCIQHQNGEAKGQLELTVRDTSGDTRVHVELNCIDFHDGNQATMSGPITQVRSPNPADQQAIGYTMIFTVQDNGEGKNAAPDLTSDFLVFPPNSGQDCHSMQPPPEHPVQGNVQVRP
jgi:hypothetical protein